MNSDQMQSLQGQEDNLKRMDDKLKEIDELILKLQEDSEGRDGLLLQQNQDITNLFSANEQILGNQNTFKEHYEKLDRQLNELIGQIQEADWANLEQVDDRVQEATRQHIDALQIIQNQIQDI